MKVAWGGAKWAEACGRAGREWYIEEVPGCGAGGRFGEADGTSAPLGEVEAAER